MLRDYLKKVRSVCPEVQIGYPCFENKLIVRFPGNVSKKTCHDLSVFLRNNNFTWICDWKNNAFFYLIWKQ
jgi:hypothetical protein